MASVERISEAFLLPTLELVLEAFPFVIRGFHSDNGSEYVNKTVAGLLNKLLIEFTKSRARRTNDNALVEGKNGAIVRKHLGYAHIPQKYAGLINTFNTPTSTSIDPASFQKSSSMPEANRKNSIAMNGL